MDMKLFIRKSSKISNQYLICQKHSDETFFPRKIRVIKSDKLDLTNLHKSLSYQSLIFANSSLILTFFKTFLSDLDG